MTINTVDKNLQGQAPIEGEAVAEATNMKRPAGLDSVREEVSRKKDDLEAFLSRPLNAQELAEMKKVIGGEFSKFLDQKTVVDFLNDPTATSGEEVFLRSEMLRLNRAFDPSQSITEEQLKTLEPDMNRALGIMAHFNDLSAKIASKA